MAQGTYRWSIIILCIIVILFAWLFRAVFSADESFEPAELLIGMQSSAGEANLHRSAGAEYRYQYLSGGAGTNNSWVNWNSNGDFARYYIEDSQNHNITPVFTYYMICQASNSCYSNEVQAVRDHLANQQIMQSYWSELAIFFQKAAAFPNTEVILHVEPDMWGFMQQVSPNDDASLYPYAVRVGSTNVAGLENLPDSPLGFAQALFVLRSRHGASNVKIAYHLSQWGTGIDLQVSNPQPSEVINYGNRSAAFYNSLNQPFDLTFSEFSDRDAAFHQIQYGNQDAWWESTDYDNHILYMDTYHQGSGQAYMLWQIPYGNTLYRSMDNTWGHYQDNVVETMLGEADYSTLNRYADAGLIGLLFGQGASGTTCACDAMNDGVTNPDPINGNSLVANSADDDGGYFKLELARYNQNRIALGRPGASPTATSPPPTQTNTPLPPTPTAVEPTNTAMPPTHTVVAPTQTPLPPTATPIAPTSTAVVPTSTAVVPTSTAVVPTSTASVPTSTATETLTPIPTPTKRNNGRPNPGETETPTPVPTMTSPPATATPSPTPLLPTVVATPTVMATVSPALSPAPTATFEHNVNTATPTTETPDPLLTTPAGTAVAPATDTPTPEQTSVATVPLVETVTPTLVSEITLTPPPISTPTQTSMPPIAPTLFDQALFLPYMVNGTR